MKLIFLDSYSERENKKSDFCGQFFLLFKIFKSSRNRTYTSNFGDWRATTALCSLQSEILVNQSENARISRDSLFNHYFLLLCCARRIAFCAAFFACGLFLQQELHVISAQRVTICSIEVFLSFSTDQKPIFF